MDVRQALLTAAADQLDRAVTAKTSIFTQYRNINKMVFRQRRNAKSPPIFPSDQTFKLQP